MNAAATARSPIRTPLGTVRCGRVSSPVAWFTESKETGKDIQHADVWTDHHHVAHERHPTREGMTWCGRRILGSDAPTHARVSAVGCRACAAAHVHATRLSTTTPK